MPIRLNLLAEAQAAEEMRRRDPVKRVIWIAVLLVIATLVWSSSLYFRAIIARSTLSQTVASVAARTNEYQSVLANRNRLTETTEKLDALQRLAAARLLNGTLLNELQKTTVDNVQLVRLRVDQTYDRKEAEKARTSNGRRIPPKPATVTEKIVLTFEGKDYSPTPGDQINRFRDAVATNDYFRAAMGKSNEVRLIKLLPPQGIPGETAFVSFALEAKFQEQTR